MQKKSLISTSQFVWMLFNVITSFTVLQVPGVLIKHAGRDAWLAVIGAWVLDVLLAIVYAYMGLRFPGQNCVQYSISILGRFFGKIIGIMFPIYFLLVASTLMRALAELVNNLFLPRTPIFVFLLFSYLLIAYGVKKGIEPIGRVCGVLGPLYLMSLLILFVFLIPHVEIHRLKPILENGFSPALSGAPFILSFIGICIIMGMYIPICNKPKNGFLAKFIAVSLGAFTIILLVVISIGIFGAEQAGNMINPGFQLARLLRLGSFLERLEIIWLIVAIAAGIMTTTTLVWAFCLGTSQVVPLRTHKQLTYPAVLIAFIISTISFDNTPDLLNFTSYAYPLYGIFVGTGIEMFLFFMSLILNKRGKNAGG